MANRRPNGAKENPVRSVRVDDATWARAVQRATDEGTTMSAVLLLFVRGYASRQIQAPRTRVVYGTSAPAAEEAAERAG